MIRAVDLDRALATYRERFADLGAFTFVVVGNLDLATLQPLVETYLGSLPSHGRHETWKDLGITFPKGKVSKTIVAGTEPKSYVMLAYHGDQRWSRDVAADADVLSRILDIRLREVLREDLGGVYGVQAWGFIEREPRGERIFQLFFGCDPANVDKLKGAALDAIHVIARDGIGEAYLTKVREQLRRQHETDLEDNGFWARTLIDAYRHGDDLRATLDVDAEIARVTSDHVKAAAAHFFDDRDHVDGVLRPKPGAAKAAAPTLRPVVR
jgi:zinc protease